MCFWLRGRPLCRGGVRSADRTALSQARTTGRPAPVPRFRHARIYCVQQWYNLRSRCRGSTLRHPLYARVRGARARPRRHPRRDDDPQFRHLLERHDPTRGIFAAVAEHLAAKDEWLRGGTIVDATPIAASPSTKNKEQKRDPEMTSSKKGKRWYFCMKAH